VVEHLQRLTDSFVTEAAKFGVELASHRRGATLRPSDLATYLERTHHLHVPGFLKEYHPYRRPAASDLHRERTILVRKAQLAAGQATGEGGAAAAAGGGRGRGAAAGGD
jgi:transcription initiation factor TFIID subunit TAF12